jgi:ATP-binding cassette subfamily G (WHITE) protein 2 (PDR)
MHGVLRANCIYTAESDVHFPELTVEETLLIAAEAQTPRSLTTRRSRSLFAQSLTNKMIASFNLSSCASTNVGNSVMRGLSGGEQKRVTLAEAYMGGAAIQCWDHSTRGMDSSTALQFICNLTTRVREIRSAAAVTIYQCSQAMYENFDYVTLLHSGKQIYYGSVRNAEAYFVDMGFNRASVNMSTADFLTALTNPPEASLLVSPGFEEVVPRCTNDFVERWKSSLEKAELHGKILTYGQKNPLGGASGLQHMAFLHELRNGHRVNRRSV